MILFDKIMTEDEKTSPDVQEVQDEMELVEEHLTETPEAETIPASLSTETVDEMLFGEPDFDDGVQDIEETPPVPSETCVEGDGDQTANLKPLLEKLEQIKNAQTALAKDFSTKIKYDATKQSQIDKLYQENQRYRDDVIEKFKLQLILAVVEQMDDADKQITHFTRQEETEKNYAKLLRGFCDVTAGFQDMLLERFDVSTFQCEPGTPFDPKRQRALRTSDTSDASQNKTVAATLRPGYEKNDGKSVTIVRPEMVEVWRYNPALQSGSPEISE